MSSREGLDTGDAVSEVEWLDRPLPEVLMNVEALTTLGKSCSICKQGRWPAYSQHVVDLVSIAGVWLQTQVPIADSVLPCFSFSLPGHRVGRLQHVRDITLGVSKRQEKDNLAYASYKLEHSPIGQALGLSTQAVAIRQADKSMGKHEVTRERMPGIMGGRDADGTA